MTDGLPWDWYSKDRLPQGWAYPLGRDAIAEGLRRAEATVGSLSLGRPKRPPDTGALRVFDVLWLGDARPGYFGGIRREGASRLLMRWTAVPSEYRIEIAHQLADSMLRRGCQWAASALTRGNAWSASDHEFLVTHVHGRLQASET